MRGSLNRYKQSEIATRRPSTVWATSLRFVWAVLSVGVLGCGSPAKYVPQDGGNVADGRGADLAGTGGMTGAGGNQAGGFSGVGGGGQGSGGVTGAGGVGATGGANSGGMGTGGTTATGGVPNTGGTGTGGTTATGGSSNVGGMGTGGMTATGGASSTGGKGTGGMTATGGSPNTGGMGTGGAATGGAGTGGIGCRKPSATNLLGNPGFASGTSSWTISPGASLATDDAEGCVASGSVAVQVTSRLEFGGLSQCLPVAVGTTYFFGFSYKQDADTRLTCRVTLLSTPDCTGNEIFSQVVQGSQISVALPWTSSQPVSVMASPGSRTAEVRCQTTYGAGAFDQFYLNPTSASF